MQWWRQGDWRETADLVDDPALARLVMTASAADAHLSGSDNDYEVLAKACEDPAVVYAFDRAGDNDSYPRWASDAIDVYRYHYNSLLGSNVPSAAAAHRAALVFGMTEPSQKYLAVARRLEMPEEVLRQVADQHLVEHVAGYAGQVSKAKRGWDEDEHPRDRSGRFTEDSSPAWRIVNGQKVAIAEKVRVAESAAEPKPAAERQLDDAKMLEYAAAQREKEERKKKRKEARQRRHGREEAHQKEVKRKADEREAKRQRMLQEQKDRQKQKPLERVERSEKQVTSRNVLALQRRRQLVRGQGIAERAKRRAEDTKLLVNTGGGLTDEKEIEQMIDSIEATDIDPFGFGDYDDVRVTNSDDIRRMRIWGRGYRVGPGALGWATEPIPAPSGTMPITAENAGFLEAIDADDMLGGLLESVNDVYQEASATATGREEPAWAQECAIRAKDAYVERIVDWLSQHQSGGSSQDYARGWLPITTGGRTTLMKFESILDNLELSFSGADEGVDVALKIKVPPDAYYVDGKKATNWSSVGGTTPYSAVYRILPDSSPLPYEEQMHGSVRFGTAISFDKSDERWEEKEHPRDRFGRFIVAQEEEESHHRTSASYRVVSGHKFAVAQDSSAVTRTEEPPVSARGRRASATGRRAARNTREGRAAAAERQEKEAAARRRIEEARSRPIAEKLELAERQATGRGIGSMPVSGGPLVTGAGLQQLRRDEQAQDEAGGRAGARAASKKKQKPKKHLEPLQQKAVKPGPLDEEDALEAHDRAVENLRTQRSAYGVKSQVQGALKTQEALSSRFAQERSEALRVERVEAARAEKAREEEKDRTRVVRHEEESEQEVKEPGAKRNGFYRDDRLKGIDGDYHNQATALLAGNRDRINRRLVHNEEFDEDKPVLLRVDGSGWYWDTWLDDSTDVDIKPGSSDEDVEVLVGGVEDPELTSLFLEKGSVDNLVEAYETGEGVHEFEVVGRGTYDWPYELIPTGRENLDMVDAASLHWDVSKADEHGGAERKRRHRLVKLDSRRGGSR